jgi:hypothetical protein
MTRTRLIALRVAGVIAGLMLPLGMVVPVADADTNADTRGTVTRDRANSGCPELRYNDTLGAISFGEGQFIPEPPEKIAGLKAAYGGEVRVFIGTGNRVAQSLTDAYKKGAGPTIADCSFTDYGVSYTRMEATETAYVGVVLGKKAAPQQQGGSSPAGPVAEAPKPDVQCGPNDEAPTVPAGQQCKSKPAVACPPGGAQAEVPAGQKCPPPANAVRVTFNRGFGSWTVNVKNNAGIGGSCTYVATSQSGLPGRDEAFEIAPNGTHSFNVLAPVGKYDVVTSCTGTYDGQQVEFGRDVQTVP